MIVSDFLDSAGFVLVGWAKIWAVLGCNKYMPGVWAVGHCCLASPHASNWWWLRWENWYSASNPGSRSPGYWYKVRLILQYLLTHRTCFSLCQHCRCEGDKEEWVWYVLARHPVWPDLSPCGWVQNSMSLLSIFSKTIKVWKCMLPPINSLIGEMSTSKSCLFSISTHTSLDACFEGPPIWEQSHLGLRQWYLPNLWFKCGVCPYWFVH